MRWAWGLAGALASCGAPPPTPVPPLVVPAKEAAVPEAAPERTDDAVGDPAVFLADGYRDKERRRARLSRTAPLTWDLAAARAGRVSLEATDESPYFIDDLVVAERHPDFLRVVIEDERLRWMGYARIEDFDELTRARTKLLAADGEPFANGCGVTVGPGSSLALERERDGVRAAELALDWLMAQGTVPAEAIDRVYPEPPKDDSERTMDCKLTRPVVVRDAPQGKVVAQLLATDDSSMDFTSSSSHERGYCRQVGAPRAGAQRIAMFVEDLSLVGYVPVESIRTIEPEQVKRSSWEATSPPVGSDAKHIYLWPGDTLYSPYGAMIGRIRSRALEVDDANPRDDGMNRLWVPLPRWGYALMLIDAETRLAADRKLAAWLDRVQFIAVKVSGGAALNDVMAHLESQREGLNRCFDSQLEHGYDDFRFEVAIHYTPDRPEPTLTPVPNSDLGSCLHTFLRNPGAAPVQSGDATLAIELEPSDVVD